MPYPLLSEHSLRTLVLVTRAAPLPRDERRATIVAATEPLLERFGRQVSTRQIAEAAGIAEGTLFRVFANKDALIEAVIEGVFDVHVITRELDAIDLGLDLPARLEVAVAVLERRTRRIFGLFHALDLARQRPQDHHHADERRHRDNEILIGALVRLLGPERDRLRVPPERAAGLLRAVTFATFHPVLADGQITSAADVVDLTLHGVLAADGGRRC